MDLAELSRRTGIERRKLRYVLDHQLVPSLHIEIVDDEVGRPRHFHEDVGFGIVCAAHLLDLGLPHPTIRLFLSGLLQSKFKPQDPYPALVYLLERADIAVAELADSKYVRLIADDIGTPWRDPDKCSVPPRNFTPTARVTLDLARIRDQVFARRR